MPRPSVRMRGPLRPFVEGFHAQLIEVGYTPLSALKQLQLLAHVSRWLEEAGTQAPRADVPRNRAVSPSALPSGV